MPKAVRSPSDPGTSDTDLSTFELNLAALAVGVSFPLVGLSAHAPLGDAVADSAGSPQDIDLGLQPHRSPDQRLKTEHRYHRMVESHSDACLWDILLNIMVTGDI